MDQEANIQLLWDGKLAARGIRSLPGQAAHIEIQLAPKYNRALYSRQHSATAQAGASVHIESPLRVIILIPERE
jgi:hypothetical protein